MNDVPLRPIKIVATPMWQQPEFVRLIEAGNSYGRIADEMSLVLKRTVTRNSIASAALTWRIKTGKAPPPKERRRNSVSLNRQLPNPRSGKVRSSTFKKAIVAKVTATKKQKFGTEQTLPAPKTLEEAMDRAAMLASAFTKKASPLAKLVSLEDLDMRRDCRWPIDTDDGVFYCGCRKTTDAEDADQHYCAEHAQRAYTAPKRLSRKPFLARLANSG